MNYHDYAWIKSKVDEHLEDAIKYVGGTDKIVGIFLQGSQNYQLDTKYSDVDTKCIVVPSFEDICNNTQPISHTFIRDNNEHIDFKDIRSYFQTLTKQNTNFLEILFTSYKWINPKYENEWRELERNAEKIARLNTYKAVKAFKGMALEKYHAMEHRYPSKLDIIDKYGYDGKQVSHLVRINDMLTRYIQGVPYDYCLLPSSIQLTEKMIAYKCQDITYNLATEEAEQLLSNITTIADEYCNNNLEQVDIDTLKLLNNIKYEIMKISVKEELI